MVSNKAIVVASRLRQDAIDRKPLASPLARATELASDGRVWNLGHRRNGYGVGSDAARHRAETANGIYCGALGTRLGVDEFAAEVRMELFGVGTLGKTEDGHVCVVEKDDGGSMTSTYGCRNVMLVGGGGGKLNLLVGGGRYSSSAHCRFCRRWLRDFALQDRQVVRSDRDELPAIFSRIVENIEVVGFSG